MSDIPRPDHWKALADVLGAEVSEQPTPPPPAEPVAAPAAAVAIPPAARRPVKPAAPKRQKHWGWLASELGLAPPPEAEPVQEPPLPEAPVADAMADVIPHSAPVPVSSTAVPSEPGDQSETVAVEQSETIDVHPVDVEPVGSVEEATASLELTTEDESQEAGSPSEAEQTEGPARRRRRRRGRRRRRDEAEETPSTDAEEAIADTEDTPSDVSSDVSEEAAESELEPAGETDERRPRRRRRKRRRAPQEERGESDASHTDSTEDQSEDDGLDDDDEPESDEGDDEQALGDGIRPKHRRIPSWSEAMDHIIANNMASRSRNPSGGSRNRGRK